MKHIPHNFYTNKKVLVTGGAGFIGSHICEKLVELQAKVTILDNFSTGTWQNLAAIKHAITIIEGDITNEYHCREATGDQDIIFHCAAISSVSTCEKQINRCLINNVLGTSVLLNHAQKAGCRRLIFSSSAAVYGNQQTACSESIPVAPLSMYGVSKVMSEELCSLYSRSYGLPTLALRYFNVYGPRQKTQGDGAGIYAIMEDALKHNKRLYLFGDGKQTRDFVSVQTVVQANLNMAALPDYMLTGAPVNVASGTSTTILGLFERLRTHYPEYGHDLEFLPSRPGDILFSTAECSRLYQLEETIKQLYTEQQI